MQLDDEGEMAAVIGKAGCHIARARALEHVVGYSIFTDASIRDFQTKSPQWTVGKNFDDIGPFGPFVVTADELPAGGKRLFIQTRLNGQVVQDASTDDMIFDVAALISILSASFVLPAKAASINTPAANMTLACAVRVHGPWPSPGSR
jgi:2-keto-4-pentenoate hydratase/2-oxohepta-3-ene-1,7-dioic acid hydratase in catechol pathway